MKKRAVSAERAASGGRGSGYGGGSGYDRGGGGGDASASLPRRVLPLTPREYREAAEKAVRAEQQRAQRDDFLAYAAARKAKADEQRALSLDR